MKILLTNPPWHRRGRWGVRAGSRWPHLKEAHERDYQPFPFYLAYSAALLEREGHQVRLIDALAGQMPESLFLDKVRAEAPDLLVAETSTPSLAHDLRLLNGLPKDLPIALAGPEVTIREKEFFERQKRVQFVMHGEYEHTLLNLVRELEGKRQFESIPSMSFRYNGAIVVNNGSQKLIEDLDWLPWPMRDGLPMHAYKDNPGGIPHPGVQMLASRGCPYQCGFCAWPQIMYGGSNYRMRSVEDILDEMEYCVHTLGFQSVYFDDDTFNISRQRTLEFARRLQDRRRNGRIRVPWAMMGRADLMTEEILEALAASGLAAVKYGVESADQKLLDAIRKNMNFEENDRMVRCTQKAGIKTHLTFTLGLPGETQETLKRTVDYAMHVSPDTLQFSITTPFPGTWYFEDLKREGLINTLDWSRYDGNHNSVIETAHVSAKELEQAKQGAYRRWRQHVWMRGTGQTPALTPVRLGQRLILSIKEEGLRAALITGMDYVRMRWGGGGLRRLRSGLQRHGFLGSFRKLFRKLRERLSLKRIFSRYLTVLGVLHGQHAFKGPDLVQIDPTNDCNSNCVGCWCHSDLLGEHKFRAPVKGQMLPYELLTRVVDQLAGSGTRALYIAGGGEPMMHPRILDFLEYAKRQHSLKLFLNTNFTLIRGEETIQRLGEIGIDSYTVSVWAGTPSIYALTHPNKDEAAFLRLKRNLNLLNQLKPRGTGYTKVYHVVNNLNYLDLEPMLDFALETGSDAVEFTVTDTVGGLTDSLLLNAEQLEEARALCRRIETRMEDACRVGTCQVLNWEHFTRRLADPRAEQAEYDSGFVDNLPCYVGWTYARITAEGNVSSCLKSHKFPIGNIYESDFSTIWNGERQKEFRRHALVPSKAEDPFFKIIGNDPKCRVGCYKSCDNLGENLGMKHVMDRLRPWERRLLDTVLQYAGKGTDLA
ncbi:MAG: radical SAM protein [Candidatus Omnitrophica bacterium]|nr:radical SAM protein [Candidatus Omnitrophota bacterium]